MKGHIDGKYGIIKQLDDAIRIPLEAIKYHDKKRTARVVHNGDEGNRATIAKYEKEKDQIQQNYKGLLLRNIERWDIDCLVELLFPYGEELVKNEQISNMNEVREKLCEFLVEYYEMAKLKIGNHQSRENYFKSKIAELESENGYSFKKIWGKK